MSTGKGAAAPPRVSVIVPVRNRRALLRQLLDALALQTVTDHEVVVVDDGSTDGSGDEALADAMRGRPVRLLRTGGAGAVAARRLGVGETRASVLAFTDSDCAPEPAWLAAGLAAIESGADLVQGLTRWQRSPGPFEHSVSVEGEDGLYATCNVFYRREAFEAAGGFDPQAGDRLGYRATARLQGLGFGEDSLLGWRVRRNGGRSVFCRDAVVIHHVFPPDLGDALERAWVTGAFPALVDEIPELRRTLLTHGVLLGDDRRVWLTGAAVGLVAGRRILAALLAAGWAYRRLARRDGRGWRRRLLALPADLLLDSVTTTALLTGSARARRLVI
ncbi:MAG TPA: glycosyltransferase family A protein [Acidimicrobiales bacterium]|nr:glycosyltransferase family A protein [Acidimicrobiales bacterium]